MLFWLFRGNIYKFVLLLLFSRCFFISIIIDIPEIEIRHKGVYDLDSIYKSIRAWLFERHYEYQEDRYKDKISDFGNEAEINMSNELKVDEFVQFNIKIETKFFGIKEFEADYKGSKRKVNNGQFFIRLKGSVVYDYKKKFKSWFSKFFLDFLIKKLLKNYYEVKYVDRLYYDLYALQTLIKEKVYMETASNAY